MLLIGKELVNVLFGLEGDLFDVLEFVFGGVFEGEADSSSDHGLEFVFLLNFVAVISHYYKKKNT